MKRCILTLFFAALLLPTLRGQVLNEVIVEDSVWSGGFSGATLFNGRMLAYGGLERGFREYAACVAEFDSAGNLVERHVFRGAFDTLMQGIPPVSSSGDFFFVSDTIWIAIGENRIPDSIRQETSGIGFFRYNPLSKSVRYTFNYDTCKSSFPCGNSYKDATRLEDGSFVVLSEGGPDDRIIEHVLYWLDEQGNRFRRVEMNLAMSSVTSFIQQTSGGGFVVSVVGSERFVRLYKYNKVGVLEKELTLPEFPRGVQINFLIADAEDQLLMFYGWPEQNGFGQELVRLDDTLGMTVLWETGQVDIAGIGLLTVNADSSYYNTGGYLEPGGKFWTRHYKLDKNFNVLQDLISRYEVSDTVRFVSPGFYQVLQLPDGRLWYVGEVTEKTPAGVRDRMLGLSVITAPTGCLGPDCRTTSRRPSLAPPATAWHATYDPRGALIVRSDAQPPRAATLTLLDLNGRTLRQQAWPAGQRELRWEVGPLPAGIYLVRLNGKTMPHTALKLFVHAKGG